MVFQQEVTITILSQQSMHVSLNKYLMFTGIGIGKGMTSDN